MNTHELLKKILDLRCSHEITCFSKLQITSPGYKRTFEFGTQSSDEHDYSNIRIFE